MTEELLDPRVRRTRERLSTAAQQLLRERDLESISVTDITTVARVSRPTFYLHYSSADDLLAETVRHDLHALGLNAARLCPQEVLFELVAELNRLRWLYRRLIGQSTQFGRSREEVEGYLTARLHEQVVVRRPDVPAERAQEIARFVSGGALALLALWLVPAEAAPETEVRAFSDRVWQLFSGVLDAVV
ncbi:TetR/AcrR family transcriptional regulator [Kineosporia sp. J2-2]|uniref:TetR/AcrR family transcriptional regulator n=1 Tax=Kineosporia corallincola TaxID=2835133 RepID=A0ABS5TGA2_9ACTN|nr:TetR/AcrR family transcriptional regulator [Kineosporia corallincola]MBT0770122.1 TetR/AcrR family transcriptional regulator [Kineosporia corallincola]